MSEYGSKFKLRKGFRSVYGRINPNPEVLYLASVFVNQVLCPLPLLEKSGKGIYNLRVLFICVN